jgi:hypothetical protein
MNSFIRRSQLISTYGIGAMIELPEETLITAGMDFWPHAWHSSAQVRNAVEEENRISDARLQKRLSATLQQKIDYFVSPAIGKILGEKSSYSRQEMPFFRFPTVDQEKKLVELCHCLLGLVCVHQLF